MPNYQGAPLGEQVKKLLEENLNYSKEIYQLARQTKRYIFWGRIMSLISLMFIVVPVILGVIYLPTILSSILGRVLPPGLNPGNLEGLLQGSDQTNLLKGGLDSYKNILDLYK